MNIGSLLDYLHQYTKSILAAYTVNLVLSKPKTISRDLVTSRRPICRPMEGLTSFLNTFGAPGKYQIIREAFPIFFNSVILLIILNLKACFLLVIDFSWIQIL